MSPQPSVPTKGAAQQQQRIPQMATSMLKSAAYERMRAENPSEFVPRSVFFARGEGSEVDRRSSLWVKAALVYESITGRHVDDGAKPVATALLLRLAQACSSGIHGNGPAVPAASSPNGVAGKDGTTTGGENQQEIETSQGDQEEEATTKGKTTEELHLIPAPDEGSDENKRVIDAIFLVVGFLPRLLPKTNKAAAAELSRKAVDEAFKSTHMQDIVTDVIKLENQLPLSDLLLVADRVEGAIHAVAGSLGKELQGLEEERLKGYKLGFSRATFLHDVVRPFCWYYSPFFSKLIPATPQAQDGGHGKSAENAAIADNFTLLDFLHASVVPAPEKKEEKGGGGKTSRMPAARELSRSEVRIAAAAGEDGRATVEFDEQSCTLRLPALVHDFKLATVARNLLAREHCGQHGDKKPVTRYFQMMNELVEEAADVRVLLRAGAVRGAGSAAAAAREVCALVKRIDGCATYPSVFMAMDVQIEKVRRFHDKRMQSFFVRYRPGVIWASSVAAVSVVAIVAARRNRG